MAHWIDNADSYICSNCGYEINNPNKTRYGAGRCPCCLSEMDWMPQDKREGIIGIAYAMQKEADSLVSDVVPVISISGMNIYKLSEHVYVYVCGVGKVNAAMGTQIFISRFSPERIFNVGTAGSFHDLPIGTVVLATEFIQHDVDTSMLGDPIGMVSTINKVEFRTDDIKQMSNGLTGLGIPFLKGRVVTGDVFMTPDRIQRIDQIFSPVLCEMEGGAIAQVCLRNRVKFASLKGVTDRVMCGNHDYEYSSNVELVSEKLNKVVSELLHKLDWM